MSAVGVEIVDGVEYRLAGRLPKDAVPKRLDRPDTRWAFGPDDDTFVLLTWADRRVAVPRPVPAWEARQHQTNQQTCRLLEEAVATLGDCPTCGASDDAPCTGIKGQALPQQHAERP